MINNPHCCIICFTDAGSTKKKQRTSTNVQETNFQSRFSGTEPEDKNKENALVKCEYDLELEHGIDIHVDEDLLFPASSIRRSSLLLMFCILHRTF